MVLEYFAEGLWRLMFTVVQAQNQEVYTCFVNSEEEASSNILTQNILTIIDHFQKKYTLLSVLNTIGKITDLFIMKTSFLNNSYEFNEQF